MGEDDVRPRDAGNAEPRSTQAVTLVVNGRRAEVRAPLDTPLLYILRNDLGLKGTRFGCGLGQCGSCAVLVDGRRATSCDLPLEAVIGRRVTTVEGLADGDRLDPLQEAFIAEGAGQCGYCLSGILVAAAALLESNPTPTDAQVRAALDAQICRCGAHPRILRAVQRAAAASR